MKAGIEKVVKIIKEIQPVDLTGALIHTGLWIFSPFKDVFFKNPQHKVDSEHDVAIYCVHGTADRVSSFMRFAERLNKNLPENITGVSITSFHHRGFGENIEFFAKELKDKIIINKNKKVILVGHSRGGLVASYFAEYLAKENNINVLSVVTIGTPFWGSSIAIKPLSTLSTSVQEMTEDSPFLRSLRIKIRESVSKYFHYAAQNDMLVQKDSCAVEKSPIVLERHGHLSIMSSWKLIDHVRENINEVIPQPEAEKSRQLAPA